MHLATIIFQTIGQVRSITPYKSLRAVNKGNPWR